MVDITQYNHLAAALIARVLLGLLFVFQGYDAIFKVKVGNIIETYEASFSSRGISGFFTAAGIWFTSLTELICGFLLILGLFQPAALYFLGLNLLVASVAFSIASPMWDMKHVFPRLALLIFLLIIPASWNVVSLDHLIINLK